MNLENLWLLLHPDGDDAGGDVGEGDVGAVDAGSDAAPSPDASPDPITLEAGSSFIPPGGTEPITWGENGPQGYIPQSEWTRKTQELAQQRASVEAREQQLALVAQRMQQQQQAAQQQPAQPGDPFADIFDAAQARGGWMAVDDGRAIIDHYNAQMQAMRDDQEAMAQTMQHLVQGQQSVTGNLHQMQQMRAEQELDALASQLVGEHAVLKSNPDQAQAKAVVRQLFDTFQPQPGMTRDQFLSGIREHAATQLNSMVGLVQTHQKATREKAQRARLPGASAGAPLAKDGKPITDTTAFSAELRKRLGIGAS